MTTLTKVLIGLIFSVLLISCNFDLGVRGTGEVTRITQNVPTFNSIKASAGMNVFLTQGNDQKVVVEANENLHEIIDVYVKEEALIVTTKENISFADARDVYVTFTEINSITATSGSDVSANEPLRIQTLQLVSTSGADIKLTLNSQSISAKSTSGADIVLKGKTDKIDATSTSGADINAKELIAKHANTTATSGADIVVHATETMQGTANSGGDIRYVGNPVKLNIKDGVSGSVSKE
ncbi:hypothetical protein GCM10009117_10210 [Gangjinia marincola]|uniref:Putative auto-transporter adhesin head GIN domain-containing protein n=1 Tax=Gangjinia marincola TaxID=578463 RepID=A0ABN1MFE1_9FLAO